MIFTEEFPQLLQAQTDHREQAEAMMGNARPANEVFVTATVLRDEAARALNAGKVHLTEKHTGDTDVYATVEISPDDIYVDRVSPEDERTLYPQFLNRPFKKPEDIAQKEAEAVAQGFYEYEEAQRWYLKERGLDSAIGEGHITQSFEFSLGDKKIPLLNFSNTTVRPEHLEQMRSSIERVTNVTGASVFKGTNAICIMPAAEFSENSCGAARGSSGVIRLHEGLLTDEFDEDLQKSEVKDIGITALEILITHELGHLVEIQNKNYSIKFGQAVGWESVYNNVTDNYGNVRYVHRQDLRHAPGESAIVQDGDYVSVNTLKHFGQHAYFEAKPVTKYAYTDQHEDFAEAFVLFAQGYTDLLDPIRANAIANVLREGSGGEHGPHIVASNETDLSSLHFGDMDFKPDYTLRVMFHVKSDKTVALPEWRRAVYKKIVDDYGNEINEAHRQVG